MTTSHKNIPGPDFAMRSTVQVSDAPGVRDLVESTGFFRPDEALVAEELVHECLEKGETASGYYFLFAETAGTLAGYACWGLIPCTVSSYDLYWIAVHPDFQGHGLGRRLLLGAEEHIRRMGGTRVYIETSHKAQYESTRIFYDRCQYKLEAVLDDFYAPGDGKVIYSKVL